MSDLNRIPKGTHVTGERRAQLTEELARGYLNGASIRQLAERSGRSYQTVRNMLTESGVTLRPRGGRRQATSGDDHTAATPGDLAYAKVLGRELRRLRHARGWTRHRMCRELRISGQTLATYELGARAVAATRLAQLCAALGVQPHQVLAAVDRSVLGVPGALRINLRALTDSTLPQLEPARRWATVRLRAAVNDETVALDPRTLAELAQLCDLTTDDLVDALRSLGDDQPHPR